MNKKPLNPYTRLLKEIRKFCSEITYRKRKGMFAYSKSTLSQGWNLEDLYQRTAAAEQLGYDVVLEAKEDGLHAVYIKKLPVIPWDWRE